MATAPRQHLPPCCHGVLLPRKDTPRVRFKSELTKYAVPSAKKDALPRLAAALTDARSALQLDRSASDASGSGSKFQTMEQIQAYLVALAEYLSLVKGFTVTAASLVSDTQPPMVGGESVVNPVVTLDASALNGSPQAALRQPLIDTAATGVDLTASRSKCLSFCSWRDVLTTSNIHAPNARIEMAQALLASGLHLLNDARVRVDAMLAERVTEIPENELKIAYQLLLHAAGVLDACLRSIDCVPRAIGADLSDLSANAGDATTTNKAQDDEAALAKWREEQQRTDHMPTAPPLASDPLLASDVSRANTNEDDLAMLNRLPDLAGGRFPQVLAWVALAQAQELVILRGISRDFVDYSLMAKLSLDVATRYSEVHAFTRRYLPCMSSALAERLQLYAAFKHAYYTAVSCYFQGAACMEKDDARHCAQAIADFKQAAKLIQQANNLKTQYDAKTGKDKDDRDRLFAIKTVYVRAEQIIQRDLEIVTRRNDSIYYERIPEPEPPCEPISLVRAVEFAAVEVHALWHDADINSCVQATPPRAATSAAQANGAAGSSRPADATAGNTQEAAKPRDGCCGSCVIS